MIHTGFTPSPSACSGQATVNLIQETFSAQCDILKSGFGLQMHQSLSNSQALDKVPGCGRASPHISRNDTGCDIGGHVLVHGHYGNPAVTDGLACSGNCSCLDRRNQHGFGLFLQDHLELFDLFFSSWAAPITSTDAPSVFAFFSTPEMTCFQKGFSWSGMQRNTPPQAAGYHKNRDLRRRKWRRIRRVTRQR
jgi:hypothetical protein